MTAFILANLAPIMFASLIVFLLFGYSVAFSLAACGLFFGFLGIELGVPGMASLLQALPLRMFGIMQNDTLLAIPFFTFMGLILERSGMAEDLLDTIGQLFGPDPRRPRLRGDPGGRDACGHDRRGGRVGDLDGLISLPIMLRYGYDRRVAERA
jgi:TRAP-type mannitol/chloroaromatic compound transport system permease large subunit